jgi:hypothetical protein
MFPVQAVQPMRTLRSARTRPVIHRSGAITKRPWVTASGTPALKEEQAAYYLRIHDYESAHLFDQPEFDLLKVVCNLRHYFGMSRDQTVILMSLLFNPRADVQWSPAGISLAWELVVDYTPALGLKDADAIAKQRKLDIEDAVTELLAYTRSGGRVEINTLLAVLNEWHPDLDASATELGRAVRAISGIKSGASKSKSYYSGFHLPKPDELLDPAHSPGWDLSAMGLPDDSGDWSRQMGLEFSACFISKRKSQHSDQPRIEPLTPLILPAVAS